MWPWEHLAVGYLGYALVRRAGARLGASGRGRAGSDAGGAGPDAGGTTDTAAGRGGPVVALAVATQLPDLVDKPLSWSLGVLPSGTSLAHSLLVAVPVVVGVALATRRTRLSAYGVALAVGWLSHLAGDALYPVLLGGPPAVGALLWPVVPAPPGASGGGLLAHARRLFELFLTFLGTPRGRLYLLGEAGLLGLAALVWLRDGAPGVGLVRATVRRARRAGGRSESRSR